MVEPNIRSKKVINKKLKLLKSQKLIKQKLNHNKNCILNIKAYISGHDFICYDILNIYNVIIKSLEEIPIQFLLV